MKKLALLFYCSTVLTSCTMTFQNIDTHGTATDLVDENLSTTPSISPTITIPVSALPDVAKAVSK